MKLMSARWSIFVLLIVGLASASSAVNGYEGRWKLADDGSCYFDSTDSGPDQCDGPGPPLGRWKLAPDGSCFWDANDTGPHQCSPPEPEPETEQARDKPDDRRGLPASTSPTHRSIEVAAPPGSTPGT